MQEMGHVGEHAVEVLQPLVVLEEEPDHEKSLPPDLTHPQHQQA